MDFSITKMIRMSKYFYFSLLNLKYIAFNDFLSCAFRTHVRKAQIYLCNLIIMSFSFILLFFTSGGFSMWDYSFNLYSYFFSFLSFFDGRYLFGGNIFKVYLFTFIYFMVSS